MARLISEHRWKSGFMPNVVRDLHAGHGSEVRNRKPCCTGGRGARPVEEMIPSIAHMSDSPLTGAMLSTQGRRHSMGSPAGSR